MADPLHSPRDPNAPQGTHQAPASSRSRWAVVVAIVVAIALLGLIVFLHLSGAIGPGIH